MTAVCFGEDHNLDVLGNYLSVDQSLVLTKAAQAAARCLVRAQRTDRRGRDDRHHVGVGSASIRVLLFSLYTLGNYLSVDQSLVLTKAAQAAARCLVRAQRTDRRGRDDRHHVGVGSASIRVLLLSLYTDLAVRATARYAWLLPARLVRSGSRLWT